MSKRTARYSAQTRRPSLNRKSGGNGSAGAGGRRTLPSASERAAKESAALERNKAYERQRHGARVLLPALDGCVFVVSDQHYYPGLPASPAHKASVLLAKRMRPWGIVSNGDAIDGASISRWPVSSFVEMKSRPTIALELGVTGQRMADYSDLDFVKFLTWNLGNHDARFETRLAEKVPEYQGVDGFTLKERFPHWIPAWRTDIAGKPGAAPLVIIKHRFKGGMHAGQNNVLWTGTSVVTGHDHMLKAYAVSNAHGIQWGIHAGTMAPVDSPFFTHYTEDNVVNWQQGFVILHFKSGRFLGPELVYVTPEGRVLFRGEEVKV